MNESPENPERVVTESSNDVDQSSVTEGSLKRYWRILNERSEEPERVTEESSKKYRRILKESLEDPQRDTEGS